MEQTLIDAHAILKTTPIRWASLAGSLPVALLERKPADGEWSAVECLQHMLVVERLCQFRLNAFLNDVAEFPAFDPHKEGPSGPGARSPAEVVAEFSQLRKDSLESIARLTPEDLRRRSRHADFGPVSLAEMISQWAAHDLNHTVQAERAVMQPFIQRCGPWQIYFKDHRIG